MICKSCNREIPDNSKFCQFCGSAALSTAQVSSDIVTTVQAEGDAPDSTMQPDTGAVIQPEAATYAQQPSDNSSVYPPANGQSYAPAYIPTQEYKPTKSGKGFAIASMVLSIAGTIFGITCCLSILGILMCVAGIIFGAVAIKHPEYKTIAIVGLVIGIVGLVIGIAFIAIAIIAGGFGRGILGSRDWSNYDWGQYFDNYMDRF